MMRSRLFYRSKMRASVRAMKHSLGRSFTLRKPTRTGTIVAAKLINVAGMEYPADSLPNNTGARVAVVNVGRPAAAMYAPSYGQSTAGIVGSPTTGTTINTTRIQAEPEAVIGLDDATIDAMAAAFADSATIEWTHAGNNGSKNEANTIEAEIVIGSVENKFLDAMAEATIKGRAAGDGTGEPDDLTANQMAAILATATSVGFYGETPSTQPAALTTADIGTVASGDATTDGVINNLRTRLGELESRLQALGLLA